jgi:heme exporter protein C
MAASKTKIRLSKTSILTALSALVVVLIPLSVLRIALWTPVEAQLGIVQKIFYFHVPSAMMMYAGFSIAFLASLYYLFVAKTEEAKTRADQWAASGAEVGQVFATLVLISGPLWARNSWGTFWTWDPQLTATFMIYLLFWSYLAIRAFASKGERRRSISAIIAILAAPNMVFIHWAVTTTHPKILRADAELAQSGFEIGRQNNGDVIVTSVLENTPAQKVGLKTDDVLLTVNENPVKGLDDEALAKAFYGPKERVASLTVSRRGAPEPLAFEVTRPVKEKLAASMGITLAICFLTISLLFAVIFLMRLHLEEAYSKLANLKEKFYSVEDKMAASSSVLALLPVMLLLQNKVDEFVPVPEGDITTNNQLPGGTLLVIAYAAMWAVVLFYIFSLGRKQASINKEMASLKKQLETLDTQKKS